jgi:hypothetical protein
MILDTNNQLGTTITIADIKKMLINVFQKPSSEDRYMNEMIEIRQQPGESKWEIDQRFKILKRKLKYLMTDMQHRALVRQFTITTVKIPIMETKVSDMGKGSLGSPTTGIKPISANRSSHQRTKGGFEELNIPAKLEQNQG